MSKYLVSRPAKVLAIVALTGGAFVAGCAVAAQPHMYNALNALENARAELQRASSDRVAIASQRSISLTAPSTRPIWESRRAGADQIGGTAIY